MTGPDLDDTLAALADPTRRQVIDLLRAGPRRAGELAATFELSAPAMSRHLKVLRTSGLIEATGGDADARQRIYRLRREPFDALQRWLGEVEAFWDGQLDAFKRHVERKTRRP